MKKTTRKDAGERLRDRMIERCDSKTECIDMAIRALRRAVKEERKRIIKLIDDEIVVAASSQAIKTLTDIASSIRTTKGTR